MTTDTVFEPRISEESHPESRGTESPAGHRKVTVLCLTYGEPAENKFYPQFAYSLSILNRLTRRVAPIPRSLMPIIAARRARERVQRFNELGWHSRLEEYSLDQVESLRDLLSAQHPGIDWRVELVLEFRRPYIWEFLNRMVDAPPDEIVVLPLYVADSDFTSGVSRTDLENFHRRIRNCRGGNPLPVPRYVSDFGFDERSGKSLADFILAQCRHAGWSDDKLRESVLILGAHGTVIRPPYGINSGARETRYLFGLVRRHLKPLFRSVRIGWLNHKVGGTWTFPEVAESGKESYDAGIRNVVYFTFGFIADNGETELEGKMQLAPYEWDDVLYLHCQNADPEFMQLLADRVLETVNRDSSETWETIGRGNSALERQEKAPKAGETGTLCFRGPGMAAVAAMIWLLIAIVLGIGAMLGFQSVGSLTSGIGIVIIAFALGCLLGLDILYPLGRRNVFRVRRLPQPSPLKMAMNRFGWWVVAVVALLGLAIWILPLPAGFSATILAGLSLGCFSCAAGHIWNFRESRPIA